jgi:hypothetical protein
MSHEAFTTGLNLDEDNVIDHGNEDDKPCMMINFVLLLPL